MKKCIMCLAAALLLTMAGCGAQPKESKQAVADQSDMAQPQEVVTEGMEPVYASQLKEGEYSVTVDSSSSMFQIVSCTLTVKDGAMTAKMTMGGTGYLKVFLGTGEEAAAADEADCIAYEETATGSILSLCRWRPWTKALTVRHTASERKCGMTGLWCSVPAPCPRRPLWKGQ
ncbi:MAG: hypothetical protein ACLTC3_14540 [Evtepia gabavorous]